MEYELLEILGEVWRRWNESDFYRHESGRYVIIYDNEYKGFGYDLLRLCGECASNNHITCAHYSGDEKLIARDVPTFDEAAEIARAHASKMVYD